jgi:hypothetical protein
LSNLQGGLFIHTLAVLVVSSLICRFQDWKKWSWKYSAVLLI